MGLLCAQETRGTIAGYVLDPTGAAVPAAKVSVTNLKTGVELVQKTNEGGYYESILLVSGAYRVSVEAAGFKTAVRDSIDLPMRTKLQVDLSLQMGTASESVSVTGETPLLDVSGSSAGRVIDTRSLEDLPLAGGIAVSLTRLAPGIQTNESLAMQNRLHSNGSASNYSNGNTGGNEYAVDGTPNLGNGRGIAYIPVSDVVQEFRVETGGFDAAIGHSVGANISIMTKAGTNELHGSARFQHHQVRWDAMPFFRKQTYWRNIAAAEAAGDAAKAQALRNTPGQPSGRQNFYTTTLGGPVVLPKLFNGRNKLFFFLSHSGFLTGQPSFATSSVPTLSQRAGDFSDLLPIGPRYQLYDPLTTRADPDRPGHFVRSPLPGNLLPKARIINPAYDAYLKLMPEPNAPTPFGQEPINNYVSYAIPQSEKYDAVVNRMDYQVSSQHRIYGRWSWNQWRLDNAANNYLAQNPAPTANLVFRRNYAATADWTYTPNASTVINTSASVNQYINENANPGSMLNFPSELGFPKYMDAKLEGRKRIPSVIVNPYSWLQNSNDLARYQTGALRSNVTHIRAAHSIQGGVEWRNQMQTLFNPGYDAGRFTFSNGYTMREEDGRTPAGSYGHGWAAFAIGLPQSYYADVNDSLAARNPYTAWFLQDQWRVTSRLTLTGGLRMEYEKGPTEFHDRMLGYFDPTASLPVSTAAEAAYAQSPLPEVPASSFRVMGGSVYPGANGASRRLWQNELMWQPRAGAAFQLNSRMVLRAGYGMFYDTLNVLAERPDQTGFNRGTSPVLTNDYGVTWLAGNPGAGISPMADPFPLRTDGTRYDAPTRSALGLMTKVGRGWSVNEFNRKHLRQQRWRAGFQRQLSSSTVIEAAYAGSYADRMAVGRTLSFLPESYWASGTTRNDAVAGWLTQNISNPFHISNFASLKDSAPLIYKDMSTNGFFTSPTIRRERLLRQFPQMNGISQNLPVGEVKTHQLELSLVRRFSRGFNLNVAYTRYYGRTTDFFFNEFDAAPSSRPSNLGRPHRLTAASVWDLPVGRGRRFLSKGLLSHIAGGFQLSLVYEGQPGSLIDWGNLFYYGDPSDVAKGPRTLDRWFNTDNFERNPAKMPAAYQRRVFPNRIEGVRTDMMSNWNGAVQREFRFLERYSMQLRLDVMNLQNRSQFAGPTTDPASSNFGRITSQDSTPNRWIQVQMRFVY